LHYKKPDCPKEVIIPEVGELREPVKWFLIAQFDPPLLRLLSLIDYLGHKGWKGLWPVNLLNNVVEVLGNRLFSFDWCAKRATNWLTHVLFREVSPTMRPHQEEEFIFPVLQLRLPIDGRYKNLLIIRTIPAILT